MCNKFVCAIFLCIFSLIEFTNGSEFKIVRTEQGQVKGYKDTTTGIFSFMNIPYASVPTGPDRFKAPLPPPVWMQPFEALDRRIICPQFFIPHYEGKNLQMQEDCLIANIHVPDTKKTNLPVYVIVHGGGFHVGYGDWVKPKTLVAEFDIIAVTFNYRLGAHGFLCLGTEDAPGNAGMKDQVALLRWVKKNIANFGGNPNDVTIGGCSAGGASVDLLTISKSTERLFNKAIPESGSNVGFWVTQRDPLKNAIKVAISNNFTDVDNLKALEEYYKTAPFEALYLETLMANTDNDLIFSPCIEKEIAGIEPFLTDDPVDIIRKGNYRKVPLLYGFTQMEGLLKHSMFDHWKDLMNENFAIFLPTDLNFKNEIQKSMVADKVKEFYFGDEVIESDEKGMLSFITFIGDIMFVYPYLRSAELHLKSGHDKVYLYEYSFVDNSDPIIPYTSTRGTNHCYQAASVCDGAYTDLLRDDSKLTEDYFKMSALMTQVWANFIKTGNPVVDERPIQKWPAVSSLGAPYMSLGNEVKLEETPVVDERRLFWDQLYEKYYLGPIPPPQKQRQRITLNYNLLSQS